MHPFLIFPNGNGYMVSKYRKTITWALWNCLKLSGIQPNIKQSRGKKRSLEKAVLLHEGQPCRYAVSALPLWLGTESLFMTGVEQYDFSWKILWQLASLTSTVLLDPFDKAWWVLMPTLEHKAVVSLVDGRCTIHLIHCTATRPPLYLYQASLGAPTVLPSQSGHPFWSSDTSSTKEVW